MKFGTVFRNSAFRVSTTFLVVALALQLACNDTSNAGEDVSRVGQAVVTAVASTPGVPCAAWNYAIVANGGDVFLNASSLVDSYQSSSGAYGGTNVSGSAVVVASGSTRSNGGVLNGTGTGNAAAGLLGVPVPSTATILPLGASLPGALNVNGTSDSITLAPGDYVASDVNVNFPGSISISPVGQVRIWVTGSLNLGGNENSLVT